MFCGFVRIGLSVATLLWSFHVVYAQQDRSTKELGIIVTPAIDRERNLAGADYLVMPNEELPLVELAASVMEGCDYRLVDVTLPEAKMTISARGNSISGNYGEQLLAYTGADFAGEVVFQTEGDETFVSSFSSVLYPSLLYPTERGTQDLEVPRTETFIPVLKGNSQPTPSTAEVWRPILEGKVFLDAMFDVAEYACGTEGLIRTSESEDSALSTRAIERLATRATTDSLAATSLLEKFQDADPDVHRVVAGAVSRAGVDAAIEPLKVLLESQPTYYPARDAIEEAIALLTNTPQPRYRWQSLTQWEFIEWDETSKGDILRMFGDPESVGENGEWRYGSGWIAFAVSDDGEERVSRIRFPSRAR